MDDSVFDQLADAWDEDITYTKHPVVKDFQRKERDFSDRVILDTPDESIGLIEIGSGTGRLLVHYADATIDPIGDRRLSQEELIRLQRKIRYIIGIDNSSKMVEKTIQNFMNYKLMSRYKKNLFLIEKDAEDVANFLPKFLKTHGLQEYPRVFLCMLHTLGNFPEQNRFAFLEAMHRVMKSHDRFVIAVWNAERFEDGITMYREFPRIVGKIKKNNVFRRIFTLRTDKPYFSHWFYPRELKEHLENMGFEINKLEVPQEGPSGRFCILIEAKKKIWANPGYAPTISERIRGHIQ